MTLRPLTLAAVAVLLVAANARPTYEQLRATFMEKVTEDQQKLKYFDNVEKYAVQYGTPEVAFTQAVTLAPGGSATLSGGCNLTKDGGLLSTRSDVEVVAARVAAGKCEVTLKAAPDALAGPVPLDAIAAVSGRSTWIEAARVKGSYTIEVTLENGWKARVKAVGFDGNELETSADWTKPGEAKPFRTTPVVLSGTATGVSFEVKVSEADLAKQAEGMQAVYAAGQLTEADQKGIEAAGKELEKCAAMKSQPAMAACMEKPQQRMAAIMEAARRRAEKAEAESPAGKEKRAFGCGQVSVSKDATGVFTGSAGGCEGRESTGVTAVSVSATK